MIDVEGFTNPLFQGTIHRYALLLEFIVNGVMFDRFENNVSTIASKFILFES